MRMVEDFVVGETIKIVDNTLIEQGIWENGDVVEVRRVEVFDDRIEVWNTDKYLSEFIYGYELDAIEKVTK